MSITKRIVSFLFLLAFMSGVVTPSLMPGTASAITTTPASGWTQTSNPYVAIIGDSITQQCSNMPGGGLSAGQEWRNSAWMGWAGATTSDWRARLEGKPTSWQAGSSYPVKNGGVLTEKIGSYSELGWLRDSGSTVIMLGTNDAARGNLQDFSDNIDWFMQQTGGRPVQWMNIHIGNDPGKAQPFNDVLYAKAKQYPQLKILDWDRFVQHHPKLQNPDGSYSPTLYPDGVHPATSTACKERGRLFTIGLPYSNSGVAGTGYWYGTSGRTINGWAVDTAFPDRPANIKVVIDDNRAVFGSFNGASNGDDYAESANGRYWYMTLPYIDGNYHKVCPQVIDYHLWATWMGCKSIRL